MTLIDRFHNDEDGAIVMMMLAAALVLLLIGWTLYDTADTVSDKSTVQGAADMAAMSQASVKARSMNMMAYTNISKRSIFAIHSTYIASFVGYAQLAQVLNWVGGVLCNNINLEAGCKIKNVGRSAIQRWRAEVRPDFTRFSGLEPQPLKKTVRPFESASSGARSFVKDVLTQICGGGVLKCFVDVLVGALNGDDVSQKLVTVAEDIRNSASDVAFSSSDLRTGDFAPAEWGGLTEKYYAQDIKALDNYQRFTAGATPWWAWLESVSRGMRNGATAASSSPLPAGMPRHAENIGEKVSDVVDYPLGLLDGTQIADSLPIRPGLGPRSNKQGIQLQPKHPNEELMFRKLSREIDGQTSQFISNLGDMITSGSGPSLGRAVTDTPLGVEHLANLVLTLLYSRWPEGGLGAEIGFAAAFAVFTHDLTTSVDGATRISQEVMDAKLGPFVANPWILNRYRNEASWMARNSNIVFTYLNRGAYEDRRQKYEVPKTERRRRSTISDYHFRTIYESVGQWGMARSELTFDGPSGTGPDLWHPAWTARLRPVALPGEFANSPITVNRSFHDALGGLAITTLVGATSPTAMRGALYDFAQMERATSAMGPATAGGITR